MGLGLVWHIPTSRSQHRKGLLTAWVLPDGCMKVILKLRISKRKDQIALDWSQINSATEKGTVAGAKNISGLGEKGKQAFGKRGLEKALSSCSLLLSWGHIQWRLLERELCPTNPSVLGRVLLNQCDPRGTGV